MQPIRFDRPRRALLGALALSLLALAVPGQALAGHDLYVYKAEQQVDMDSDDQVTDLGCKPGDHVLDGMWRLDHADQDDDDHWQTAIARSVDVIQASPIDGSTYRFHFVKQAIGRAQLKVFVTCLAAETDVAKGHKHSFAVSDFFHQTQSGWDNTEIVPDWDWDAGNGETACPAGTWAVSPGFEFTSPVSDEIEPGSGRMYASQYSSHTMRNWKWAFQFPSSGGQVDLTLRCLRIRVDTVSSGSAPAGDRHKLVGRYLQYSPSFRKRRADDGQSTCGAAYKAVVSGFAIDPAFVGSGLNDWSATKLWYLGMDPRIKTRALRVLNSSGVARLVDMRTLCLNYRTT
jgi:hypothetical protein